MPTTTQRGVPTILFANLEGKTSVAYSPDGIYMLVAGASNILRRFITASSDEPIQIETSNDNTAVAVSNEHIVSCSEDGTTNLYSLTADNDPGKLLVRATLPIRDVVLSPDGAWAAIASDETTVKVVNVQDNLRIRTLKEINHASKHVSFHPSGNILTVSGVDGVIYVYSLSSEEPELKEQLREIIPKLDGASEASSKVAWHPDGRGFAAATPTKDIVVVSRTDWTTKAIFANGHSGDVTDFAWSPNGAFLLSAGKDGRMVLWETKSQCQLHSLDYAGITSVAWHPTENLISWASNKGKLFTLQGLVPEKYEALLQQRTVSAPLGEPSQRIVEDRPGRRPAQSRGAVEELDDILGGVDDDEDMDDLRDFLEDDDNAGYAEPNINGKRPAVSGFNGASAYKRPAFSAWVPEIHEPFQPSSTPWKGNRRYLCLNMVGFIWTINQGDHHTVTAEFYDRGLYRDFHFTDPWLYDKACLNEDGTLFSCQPNSDTSSPAMIYYRPHETWHNRVDWRTSLPEGEEITSLALGEKYVVACTSKGYVRVYTLHGVPFRVYRQKHAPVVTCASFRDYIFVVGNGPVGADGTTLVYSLENVKREEVMQANDVVALPPEGRLVNAFFSDNGDPMIYDSEGVLLVLQHWRDQGQARWVPLLDTKNLERLAGGGKEESYWPVAVANDLFHCIILKGGEKHPFFPRPLLSEFPFQVPLSSSSETTSSTALEQEFLLTSILHSLASSRATHAIVDDAEKDEIAKKETGIDRALLRLLQVECLEEDRGAKALEICGLFRRRGTLDLAVKVAQKYGREVLAGKIAELGEGDGMEED